MFKRREHKVPGLNTTSTADISFMLLIFFLVASSLDVDKGLVRQLPPAENKQKQQDETAVNKNKLMALKITADNRLLVNDKPMEVEKLQEYTEKFIHRLGKQHLISIDTDPQSDYNVYFNVQHALVAAYHDWRNTVAIKIYHRKYNSLNQGQKNQIKDICPQRIAETYNAAVAEGGGV